MSKCLAQSGCSTDTCWLNETYGVGTIGVIMPVLKIKKLKHRELKQLAQAHTVKIEFRILIQKLHTIFFPLSISDQSLHECYHLLSSSFSFSSSGLTAFLGLLSVFSTETSDSPRGLNHAKRQAPLPAHVLNKKTAAR